MVLTLACAFLACTQSPPTAPDAALLLAESTGDITVTYFCGNTFLFRNQSLDTLTLTWRVRGIHEEGTVFLPARLGEGVPSETYLTTKERGPLEVYRGGRILRTVPNMHLPPCEIPSDTATPPIPASYGLPRGDSVKTFATLSDTMAKGYREYFEIRFQDTVSGPTFHAFLRTFQATVTGGSPAAGTYILRFPDPGPAYQNVADFLARLRADPRIAAADGIEYALPFSTPNGLRPLDGPQAQPTDWKHPQLSSPLWGYNAVRAPLAWGCQTGDPAAPVSIGVLDYLFDATLKDLAPGSTVVDPSQDELAAPGSVTAAPLSKSVNSSHGTGVAGVIGAIGNDTAEIAGIIWNRRLRLHALARGTDVVWNFGMRLETVIIPDLISDHSRLFVSSLTYGSADDVFYPKVLRAMDRFVKSGGIIVMPTENLPGMHLTLSQLRALRGGDQALLRAAADLYAQYPGQVWFVVGTGRDGNAGSFAGRYDGMEALAAPGEDILTLVRPVDYAGVDVQAGSGSSFAAPMVAGAAALLLSTDPTLTGPQLLQMLRAAATEPRPNPFTGMMETPKLVSGGVPSLDIYNALRLVSQRAGTSLCGNRMAIEGRDVKVERAPGSFETLATVGGTGALLRLLTFHGGRKIVIRDQYDDSTFAMQADGSWAETGLWDQDSTGLTGSAVSQYGEPHDRGFIYHMSGATLWTGRKWNDYATQVAQLSSYPDHSDGGSQVCVRELVTDQGSQCQQMISTGFSQSGSWRPDVAMLGDSAVLLMQEVTRYGTTYDATWYNCYDPTQVWTTGVGCRFHPFSTAPTLLWTSIWKMDLAVQSPKPDSIGGITGGRYLVGLTSAEDGSSFAASTGVPDQLTGFLDDCATQFYTLSAPGQAIADPTLHYYGATRCDYLYWEGGFGTTRQQLTATPSSSPDGFALEARLVRAIPR